MNSAQPKLPATTKCSPYVSPTDAGCSAINYLLRVVVPDIAGYDLVYKKLIRSTELFDVSSSFAMEQIKYTTALPVTAA